MYDPDVPSVESDNCDSSAVYPSCNMAFVVVDFLEREEEEEMSDDEMPLYYRALVECGATPKPKKVVFGFEDSNGLAEPTDME